MLHGPTIFPYAGDNTFKFQLSGDVLTPTFSLHRADGALMQTLNAFDDGIHDDDFAADRMWTASYPTTLEGQLWLVVRGWNTDHEPIQRIRNQALSTTPTLLPANSVLFVTGDLPTSSDTAVISRLQAMQLQGMNLNVIVKDHNTVTAADAGSGVRLILISSSIASTKLNTMFKNTPVPVIVWENGLFDDMGMTGSAGFGQTTAATQLTISQPSHPLAAGLSGTVNVHTSAQIMGYASGLPNSAIKVAELTGTATRSVL